MRRALAYGVAASLLSFSAEAASCPQEQARYQDRDKAYELAFLPEASDAQTAEHRFTLSVLGTSLKLDGYVMGASPDERPSSMLFFNCPEGDVTGADLQACTIWQGVIYGESGGTLSLLPAAGQPAAGALLLPALGPAIRQSTLFGEGKAQLAPWDVLTFSGCAS
ncbi:hypothetical protein ACLE20_09350 [Rhizobium sp. YIM 134829]|uniref:hypothetical protein n=1 Tax=Rhizobium sp. YIM 134829 TaxID=3390453 RepID=UPI00397A1AA5